MSELLSNPLITGTLMVLISGALASHAMKVPHLIFRWIRNHAMFTVEIDSADSGFTWLKQWISTNATSRWLTAMTTWPPSRTISQSSQPSFHLCPRGFCIFKFEGRRFLCFFTREEVQGSMAKREVIILQCLFGRKQSFLNLLRTAERHAMDKDGKSLEVWIQRSSDWQLSERKFPRSMESIQMRPGVVESLVADAKRFLDSEKWYQQMGIPWHRGYLFSGPPGNGKSSLAHVLASQINKHISVLNLASAGSDAGLIELLASVPDSHIIVIEDIDAAYTGRKNEAGNSISFSGLLNAIDGPVAREGRIVVMTTNHPDKLDPALIRPGRADLHLIIENADANQAESMARRLLGDDAPESKIKQFGSEMAGKSMAAVQQKLMQMVAA